MTSLIRRGFLLLLLVLIPGCVGIGVETIGPRKTDEDRAIVGDIHLGWVSNKLVVLSPIGTNQFAGLHQLSTNDILNILGTPTECGSNFIRYSTGERAWHGIAIDFAIFPIPLTIPLMIPGGKIGYVDFSQDASGVKVVGYGPCSKFFGFVADDYSARFSSGTEAGFWFHPD